MVDRLLAVAKDATWLNEMSHYVYRDTRGHVFLFRALITGLLSIVCRDKIKVDSAESFARVVRQYVSLTMTMPPSLIEDRVSGGMRSLTEHKDIVKRVLSRRIRIPSSEGVVDAHDRKYYDDVSTLMRRGLLIDDRRGLAFPSLMHRRLAFGLAYSDRATRLNTESIDDFLVGVLQVLTPDVVRRKFSEGVWDVSEERPTPFWHHVFAALNRCLPPSHCVVAELDRVLGACYPVTNQGN